MLTIELVPRTAWLVNVRSEVSKSEWDKLRRATYKAAGYRCEICNGKGHKHPVECHEVFEYDDEEKSQTLKRLIAICPKCNGNRWKTLQKGHRYQCRTPGCEYLRVDQRRKRSLKILEDGVSNIHDVSRHEEC